MLHEEIAASLRQQRAIHLIPRLDSSQKMRLRGGAIDVRWRRRALRRLAARWKPAEPKDEQPRDLLGGSAGAPFHRRVVPAGPRSHSLSARPRSGPSTRTGSSPIGVGVLVIA